jgi:hypothetical protein
VLGGRDGKMFWIYCRKDRREREKEWARAGKRERSMAGRVKVPLLALQLASGRRRRLLIAPWVKPFSESTPRPMRHSWLLEQWTVDCGGVPGNGSGLRGRGSGAAQGGVRPRAARRWLLFRL